MQQSGRGGWVGWLIFVFLVFGSNFLPPLARWLTQLTGFTITAPMIIVAVIVLSVVGSLASSTVRQVLKARGSSETSLPLPPSISPPPERAAPPTSRPAPPPAAVKLPPSTGFSPPRHPSGEQRLPGPPRFDPIIDPRMLTFGILGMLALGGLLLVALNLP